MTDHYAVVNPEALQPVVTPDDITPEGYVCPQCGKAFDSANGTRRAPLGSPPGEGDMPRVRREVLWRRRPGSPPGSGAQRPGARNRTASRKLCPECGKTITAKDLSRHRRDVHGVDLPKRGRPPKPKDPDLTVDDLFTATLGMLFPKGVIPVSKLEPLFRWREDTRRMLDEVASG